MRNEEHGLGKETTFEFKYVPQFDTVTDEGKDEGRANYRSVERRNLQTLMVFAAVMGVGSYVAGRTGWGIVERVLGWWNGLY